MHNAFRYFNPNDGGNITVLTYLLSQRGVNGDTKGQYGHTLLDWACININALPIEIFKLLIEKHGADFNAQNNDNDTPIYRTLRYFDPNKGGDISVLQYLSNQTNTKGKDGYTILHYACGNINKLPIEIFKLLIETLGYDVNA